MATNLEPFGPFEIPFGRPTPKTKKMASADGKSFWDEVRPDNLKEKQGVYIFAIRAARGYKPWYVGQATKTFKQECFTPHKLKHYNAVFLGRKGTPVMFLICLSGNRKKVPKEMITDMERFFTHLALERNPLLRNVQNTKNTPKWSVAGIVRHSRGRRSLLAKKMRRMLGME